MNLYSRLWPRGVADTSNVMAVTVLLDDCDSTSAPPFTATSVAVYLTNAMPRCEQASCHGSCTTSDVRFNARVSAVESIPPYVGSVWITLELDHRAARQADGCCAELWPLRFEPKLSRGCGGGSTAGNAGGFEAVARARHHNGVPAVNGSLLVATPQMHGAPQHGTAREGSAGGIHEAHFHTLHTTLWVLATKRPRLGLERDSGNSARHHVTRRVYHIHFDAVRWRRVNSDGREGAGGAQRCRGEPSHRGGNHSPILQVQIVRFKRGAREGVSDFASTDRALASRVLHEDLVREPDDHTQRRATRE